MYEVKNMIVSSVTSPITFGYSNQLKTLWRAHKLPSVEYGFYGGYLTQKNVSLEHLKPASQHGKTKLKNLVLATAENNRARGNQPIEYFMDYDNVIRYLSQFKDVKVGDFNGNKYIKEVIDTLSHLIDRKGSKNV
jgi:hypothetical protein